MTAAELYRAAFGEDPTGGWDTYACGPGERSVDLDTRGPWQLDQCPTPRCVIRAEWHSVTAPTPEAALRAWQAMHGTATTWQDQAIAWLTEWGAQWQEIADDEGRPELQRTCAAHLSSECREAAEALRREVTS